MPYFKIYAGLSGGFGGAVYQRTIQAKDEEEASNIAWEYACDTYDSYAGSYGLREPHEIAEKEGLDMVDDEEEIWDIYCEERDGWIDYYIEYANSEDDTNE